MKTNKVLIIFILMFLVLIIGCTNGIKNEGNKIIVEKRIGETDKYEYYSEIKDKEEVQKVKDVLSNISWKNAVVCMAYPPQYRFHFESINDKVSGVVYELLISPDKSRIELVIDSADKYVHLNKEISKELFKIITGKELGEDYNSKNIFGIKQFENAMKDKGYKFEIKDVEQDFLPTERKRMMIDDKAIDLYLFSNDKEMENEASRIDNSGSSYDNGSESVKVSWVSYPHFYKKGSLIIQYIGEDKKIVSDLKDILGEQFAGYTPQ